MHMQIYVFQHRTANEHCARHQDRNKDRLVSGNTDMQSRRRAAHALASAIQAMLNVLLVECFFCIDDHLPFGTREAMAETQRCSTLCACAFASMAETSQKAPSTHG